MSQRSARRFVAAIGKYSFRLLLSLPAFAGAAGSAITQTPPVPTGYIAAEHCTKQWRASAKIDGAQVQPCYEKYHREI
jgi:hypothetical protein